jgi:hypothetical protein
MPSLSPRLQRSRKAYDFEVADAILPHPIMSKKAYASIDDARRGRELSREDGLAGRANVYDVTFTFNIKAGERRSIPSATARFDLDANGNYPFSAPSVQFHGAIPWILHVQPSSGMVCLGDAWRRAQGKMLLAQLAIQVAHMLNFDEPDCGQAVEFNNAALDYWRETMGSKPLHAALVYPSLPLHLTHGIVSPSKPSGFRMVDEEPASIRRPVFRVFSVEEGEL